MKRIWAVIPVKPLVNSKTRLASVLTQNERVALTLWLFERLLGEVNEVATVEQTVVVTRDARLKAVAERYNAWVASESTNDELNDAVTLGVALAAQNGATHVLVLPSDLPMVDREDLDWFLQHGGETAVLICSDRQMLGTNALLIPTRKTFAFSYGVNSLEQHVAEAARLGYAVHLLYNTHIQFDIDTISDWEQYQNSQINNCSTKGG